MRLREHSICHIGENSLKIISNFYNNLTWTFINEYSTNFLQVNYELSDGYFLLEFYLSWVDLLLWFKIHNL